MGFGNFVRNIVNVVRTAPSRIAEFSKTNPSHIADDIEPVAVKSNPSWLSRDSLSRVGDSVKGFFTSRAARELNNKGTIIQKGQSPLSALTHVHNTKTAVNIRVKVGSTGQYRNLMYRMTESE